MKIKMSPKLSKRRDELAEAYAEKYRLHAYRDKYDENFDEPLEGIDFKAGFDACHAEMLPMLEQMVAQLEMASKRSSYQWAEGTGQYHDFEYVNEGKIALANEVLAAYQAWREE